MPTIFVDVDNSDPHQKIFSALKAGDAAKDAEARMQAVTKQLIDKEADFTTTKPKGDAAVKQLKGYVVRLTLTKVEANARTAKCIMAGEIVEYPKVVNHEGKSGEVLVAPILPGTAEVKDSRTALIDCVEALTEAKIKQAFPAMRKHFAKRP